jgi:hypothetical protein
MFLDKNLFRVGREFGRHVGRIADELARLPAAEFVPWPDHAAYSDGWLVLPLLLDETPPGFDPPLDRYRRLCPETWALLQSYPEVITAGFSRLLPGCHIFPHRDLVRDVVYRYHLCLRTGGPAGLRAGEVTKPVAAGADYVFDHREQHESVNLGIEPRDVLLVDFRATTAELAALAAWRRDGPAA